MTATPDPAALAEADALARAGKLAEAATLMEAALAGSEAAAPQWLQLAGLRRALGQPRRALAAVHSALALSPYDFVALVMRASLLERLGDSGAGPAWDEALAQRPAGELAPPLAAAVAAGEATLARWREARETRVEAAIRPARNSADADAAWRIGRFRDNVLRKTRVYHSSPTHFHFPGLTEREFHPRNRFPWLAGIEAEWTTIRGEMEAALASSRAELVPYLEYQDHEALAQWRELNRNPDWSAIHLIKSGQEIAANAALCPRTMELMRSLPQPKIPGASPNVLFSLLAPHTAIPPHVGVNNARLLCHLPLVVPDGCWFRVGAETRPWREGEGFVFDDTIEHEAANPSDVLRVVMIFDIWHPDLAEAEREAVAALIAAEGSPADQG